MMIEALPAVFPTGWYFTLCTLGKVIEKHGMSYHFDADDKQFCLSALQLMGGCNILILSSSDHVPVISNNG